MNLPMNILVFDGFISFIGAVGLWPVFLRLWRSSNLIPLEKNLKWVMLFFFVVLLIRIPDLSFGISGFGHVVYLFSTLLSFSLFLYLETLLRRHMPLWLKIFISVGSGIFIIDTILGNLSENKEHLVYYGAFLFLAAIFSSLVCLFRNRSDYSRAENTMIDINFISVLFLVPIVLTDITTYGIEGLPRMGVLGILLFAYVSLYNQALFQDRGYLLKRLFKSFVFSILLTLATVYIVNDWSLEITGRLFTLFFSVNLIFRIYYAVKHLDGEDEFYGFVRAVNDSSKDKLINFLLNIEVFFGKLDRLVLTRADLAKYDAQGIYDMFETHHTHLFNIFDIQESLSSKEITNTKAEMYEQIIDLLEKHEMTYVCKFGKSEPILVLFHVPMVAYQPMIELKTRLIAEVSHLVERAAGK